MARLATLEDFENNQSFRTVPGLLYSNYRRYPFFAIRAADIAGVVRAGSKILVVGCGWGFLVDELSKLGLNVWGLDASDYAVQKAGTEVSGVASRVILGDCTRTVDVEVVALAAGLGPGDRFDLCVTEDLLPVLEESEVTSALEVLRGRSARLYHLITCTGEDSERDMGHRLPGLLWKSSAEWRTIVGRMDICVNAEGNRRF